MENTPFRARPEFYRQNIDGSRRTYSRAGIIERPDGTHQPGVIVFRDRYVLSVLPIDEAVRLANELIDATENQVGAITQTTPTNTTDGEHLRSPRT